MEVSPSTLILGAVVLAAGSFALGRETAPTDARIVEVERAEPAAEPATQEGMDPSSPDPHGMGGGMGAGMGGAMGQQPLAADNEPAAIEWTIPASWHTVPNPSSMRIATYSVPHAASDTVDGDVSVTRAGGDVTSNIERWAGQFAGAEAPTPQTHTVHGIEVTIVQIEGVYTNGMSASAKPQAGWALLAAIVKTPGMPYFFKLTGPAATVHGARAAFNAMIDGIHSAG
jgi:hypothetical protein